MGLNTRGTLLMSKYSLKNMMTHRNSRPMIDDDKKIEMQPSDTEKPMSLEPEHDIEITSIPQRTRNIPVRFHNYVMGK